MALFSTLDACTVYTLEMPESFCDRYIQINEHQLEKQIFEFGFVLSLKGRFF